MCNKQENLTRVEGHENLPLSQRGIQCHNRMNTLLPDPFSGSDWRRGARLLQCHYAARVGRRSQLKNLFSNNIFSLLFAGSPAPYAGQLSRGGRQKTASYLGREILENEAVQNQHHCH